MTRHRLICWHLGLWCCSMLRSAQGKCPSPGRPPCSPQFSSVAMPQTQPTTGQSQLVSRSAGYTPASWYSALSHTQSSSRSATQTGYRPELGTIPPTFACQHAVDKHRHAGKPLYLCFVDLKAAYDKVQGQLLCGWLRRLGMHSHMLGAVLSPCMMALCGL